MANVTNYVSKKLTANILEQSVTLNTNVFKLIKNTSSNTVTINIDNATTEDNTIELGANESIENFNAYCKTLYYKASADNSVLKIIALRDKE
jgi:hypothetical protein